MNDVFGKAVRATKGSGLVLVLDDDTEPEGGFGTSRRLVDFHGIARNELRIVQSDSRKARRMKSDKMFGVRVVEGDVASHLATTCETYKAV